MTTTNYHQQSVTIVLNRDSDLYRRIETYAVANGATIEAVVDSLVSMGAYSAMANVLDKLEKK